MVKLGVRWKEFKSTLHRTYIVEGRDEDPCAKHNIKQHVWEEFVKQCNTPEYKVHYLIHFIILEFALPKVLNLM